MDNTTSAQPNENETGILRVEIHTGSYIALGMVQTRHQRLIDVLDNMTSPYLRLENARIQPLHTNDREGLCATETLLVSRSDIRIAMPHEPGDDTRHSRLQHPQYIPKCPVPAKIYLDIMEIEGQIYIREGEDALHATQHLTAPLIAVTQARVRYLDESRSLPFESDIIVVNREFIQLISLLSELSRRPNSRLEELLSRSSTLGMRVARAAASPNE